MQPGAVLASTLLIAAVAGGPSGARADACSSLRGNAAAVAENRAHRQQTLHRLETAADEVTVIHGGDWDEATALALAGVTVVAVDPVERTATLDLDLEGVCDADLEVGVDQNIGANVRVLAVTPQAVLVEREGALRYLPVAGADVHVEVVWRSPYAMAAPAGRGGVAPKAVPARGR